MTRRQGDRVRLLADDPFFWVAYHQYEFADNLIIRDVQFARCCNVKVATLDRKFQPDLSFGGFGFRNVQTIFERALVASSAPRFCDVGTHCARRAANLIGEYVSSFGNLFVTSKIFIAASKLSW